MACVLSLGFMAFQALYILVCALLINERLMKNAEAEGLDKCSCSKTIWFIFFILIFAGNVTWLVFLWKNFGTIEGCGVNLGVLIFTTISFFVMQIIPCFGIRDDTSELTSAIAISYILFLQWSALISNPDETCNPHEDSSGMSVLRITINLVIVFTAMITAASTSDDEVPSASELKDKD